MTARMEVQLLPDGEVGESLGRGPFAEAWDALHGVCPWATGYQTRGFARAWYESYSQQFAPLLAIAQADDGRLAGLLALAQDRGSGQLVNVGAHQAEYHGWLARPELGESFILAALRRLRAAYPGNALRFRYLPPGVPAGWLNSDLELARLAEVHTVPRPLLGLEDEERQFADKLRKKSNKSRLNRLRDVCGGELVASQIASEAELATVIDEIARNYDDRQGAANQTRPFAEDPRKRDFHLRLFREGLLHGLVLRAGGRFVAAILSVPSREFLSVGIFAHAVGLADHSPGKFGMLHLGRAAAQQGYAAVDLTPGGAWKDRFATSHDTVVDLTVRFSLRAARWDARKRGIERSAKRLLAGLGLTPQDLRRMRDRVAGARP